MQVSSLTKDQTIRWLSASLGERPWALQAALPGAVDWESASFCPGVTFPQHRGCCSDPGPTSSPWKAEPHPCGAGPERLQLRSYLASRSRSGRSEEDGGRLG